jgi:hypothetical protein
MPAKIAPLSGEKRPFLSCQGQMKVKALLLGTYSYYVREAIAVVEADQRGEMDVFRAMAILIEYPILALAPAVAFGLLFATRKAPLSLATAVAWMAYAIYEYGMDVRLLCTGECNIRVDLLLIYPMLVALSLASLAMFAASRNKGV